MMLLKENRTSRRTLECRETGKLHVDLSFEFFPGRGGGFSIETSLRRRSKTETDYSPQFLWPRRDKENKKKRRDSADKERIPVIPIFDNAEHRKAPRLECECNYSAVKRFKRIADACRRIIDPLIAWV